MDTLQIEALANRDRIATGSTDIGSVLRNKVIPAFLLEVGDVGWLRKFGTFSVVANTRVYNTPLDCFIVRKIWAPGSGCVPSDDNALRYIGDDEMKVAQAEQTTEPGTPTAWYPVQRDDADPDAPGEWLAIKLDRPPEASMTLPYKYTPRIRFTDSTTNVDLARYIPVPFHYGLVHWLRAELLVDRFGEGDRAYQKEMADAMAFVEKARDMFRELGPQGTYVATMD